jgi:hypothetical protein
MRLIAPVQSDAEPAAPAPAMAQPMEGAIDDHVSDVAQPRTQGLAVTVAWVASLIWLAAATAAIYLLVRFRPVEDLTLTGLAGLAAGVTAPLSAIWLAALAVANRRRIERAPSIARLEAAEARLDQLSTRTRQEIEALDGLLSTVAQRFGSMRGEIGGQMSELMEAAGRLEERSAAVSRSLACDREAIGQLLDRLTAGGNGARVELSKLIEMLPEAEARAGSAAAAFAAGVETARTGVADIDRMVQTTQASTDAMRAAAEAAADRMCRAAAMIDGAGSEAAERLDQRAAALTKGTDAALERAAVALDSARSVVGAQIAAVVAGTDQARATLEAVGGEAARMLAERFAEAAAQAERLTRDMQEQEVRSRALIAAVERGFGVLDAKLANAAQTSGGVLDRLNERLSAVRDQMHELATPLGGTEAATRELEAAVSALRTTTNESIEALASVLPDNLARTSQGVDAIRAATGALVADIDGLRGRATDAMAPVDAGRAAIDATLTALDAQRVALADTADHVTSKLNQARAIAADVDADTQNAALTATTRLVEAMMRVREIATQAEGTMRATLDGIVSEARSALEAAGLDAVRDSFTKRVRVELAEVEAAAEKASRAAQSSAERLSRQLISVAETAAAVEARIAQADARLENASHDDLARRSGLLIESLNSASIDIAKALSTDVADTAWASYLKGDRGIFTRRAVKLLDSGAARAIARRAAEDGEFRDSVNRYIHDFEALMRRTTSERDGSALSVALLSSDVGRLYVALAQALERLKS